MEQCWHNDAKKRPSFREIGDRIQTINATLLKSEASVPATDMNDDFDHLARSPDPTIGVRVDNDIDPSYETKIPISDNQYLELIPTSERKSSTNYEISTMPLDNPNLSASQSDYEVQIDPFAESKSDDYINQDVVAGHYNEACV